jgi:hypothetical protein
MEVLQPPFRLQAGRGVSARQVKLSLSLVPHCVCVCVCEGGIGCVCVCVETDRERKREIEVIVCSAYLPELSCLVQDAYIVLCPSSILSLIFAFFLLFVASSSLSPITPEFFHHTSWMGNRWSVQF